MHVRKRGIPTFADNLESGNYYNMESWPVQTRIAAVEAFIQTGSVTEAQRALRRNSEDSHAPVPERHSILRALESHG
jgi:hypothetical protein